MLLFKKISLLLIVAIISLILFNCYDNNWEKLLFYLKNGQLVTLNNMQIKCNYGLFYKKINNSTDNGLIASLIEKNASGNIIIITNTTYSSPDEIYSYYHNLTNRNELISYENTKVDGLEAISVKYYVLPSREYLHTTFVIPKNVVIGYTGPKENEIRFKSLINSIKFIN